MEGAEAELLPLAVAVETEQPHDLPLADHVGDLLRGRGGGPGRLPLGRLAVEAPRLHEIFHRLLEREATGVQVDVDADAGGAVARQTEHLPLRRRSLGVEAGA